jgi:biopolymer transport protein TolR
MPDVDSRGGSRRRRAMTEFYRGPFMDVMLVLLIIFMVTAPLITTGVIDVPSVGKAPQAPEQTVELELSADDKLMLRTGTNETVQLSLAQLATRVKQAQAGNAQMPVLISADKTVRYESVVKVMDVLQRAGIQRVGLAVKSGASAN